MPLPRPRSLNGLILVGFGLVALPLLVAVVWALVSLDRLAEQSEQLVVSGVSAAENNRALSQQVASFERVARQYLGLRTEDSLSLMQQDLASIEDTIALMLPLARLASAPELALSIPERAASIVDSLSQEMVSENDGQEAIAEFASLRQDVTRLSTILSNHIELELSNLQA